jgi:hypothetical protein
LAGNTFEFERAAFRKFEPSAGDKIGYNARHKKLVCAALRHHARGGVHRDPADILIPQLDFACVHAGAQRDATGFVDATQGPFRVKSGRSKAPQAQCGLSQKADDLAKSRSYALCPVLHCSVPLQRCSNKNPASDGGVSFSGQPDRPLILSEGVAGIVAEITRLSKALAIT